MDNSTYLLLLKPTTNKMVNQDKDKDKEKDKDKDISILDTEIDNKLDDEIDIYNKEVKNNISIGTTTRRYTQYYLVLFTISRKGWQTARSGLREKLNSRLSRVSSLRDIFIYLKPDILEVSIFLPSSLLVVTNSIKDLVTSFPDKNRVMQLATLLVDQRTSIIPLSFFL